MHLIVSFVKEGEEDEEKEEMDEDYMSIAQRIAQKKKDVEAKAEVEEPSLVSGQF